MKTKELVKCFEDTLEFSKSERLKSQTVNAVKSSRVYKENFISGAIRRDFESEITVEGTTSFDAAGKYRAFGKIAVLNFANPRNPGGGVQHGAMAQEECLCRSSNLYYCLLAKQVYYDYYEYHLEKNSFFTDRLIYTSDVTVFKDDSEIPQIMPEENWFNVDIITCAAPYIAKSEYVNTKALFELFKSRIRNICESAIDNSVDVLILGAFGCGAFKNPPAVVAQAFRAILCDEGYKSHFKKVVFAIKSSGEKSLNLETFRNVFVSCETNVDGTGVIYTDTLKSRFNKVPKIVSNQADFDKESFLNWQKSNKYYAKQFSVLGDSISTFAGYNPGGYSVFYSGVSSIKLGVTAVQDTWWDNVISFFGGELLVNNSWSGSRVTKLPSKDRLFPSGCSDERTAWLHINEVKPDVIIVYLGTNDWVRGVALADADGVLTKESDYCSFDFAYNMMLSKIKANYPNSEVWCCTLSETYISKNPNFKFPHSYGGIHIEEYNQVIKKCALNNQCRIVDIYSCNVPYDTIDGTHPTASGMLTLAENVIRKSADETACRFLD